jgi:hypothetical protein
MNAMHKNILLLAALVAALPTLGCASFTGDTKGKKKDSSWSFFKKKEYQTPQSINATWTHDIFTAEEKPPTRGFGGRIYFYNERSQAIPVDGELTVYGFYDTHRNHDGMSIESADKRFRFTPEQFTTHFSESQLGASYSIWIPWDPAPGYKKKIMLIPTFKTKEGRVIRGNAATLLLPGPPSEEEQVVIQASAQKALGANRAASPAAMQTQPKTTTIPIPVRSLKSQPHFSPEQAAAYIEQVNRGELAGVLSNGVHIPSAGEAVQSASSFAPVTGQVGTSGSQTQSTVGDPTNSIQTKTVPATSVATPLPGFAMPNGLTLNVKEPIAGTPYANSSTPGFAPGFAPAPGAHSSPNLPPAPASSVVPSSSYLFR